MDDDQRTDAELAVLDMALAEALTRRSAPDVWERLAAAAAVAPPRRARGHWLAAALLLLGLGVVVAIATLERQPPALTPDAVPAASDVDSLATLRERLRNCRRAYTRAEGSWCAATRSWIDFRRRPLDDLLTFGMSPYVEPEELDAIRAAIESATLGAKASEITWTHHIESSQADSRFRLLLRVGGEQPPLLAFASDTASVLLNAPGFPFAALAETLHEVTKTTLQKLGLVLGPEGFAAMPTGATSLRLLAVTADRANELHRFGKLTSLDLSASPQWHAAHVLRALAVLPIDSLVLSPADMAPDAYTGLGSLRSLTKLFLANDPLRQLMGQQPAPTAASLDDAAIAHLRELADLKELCLAGGTFTDAAFGTLASLPELRQLVLIACPNVRGTGIDQCRQITSLFVRSGTLSRDFARRVALLPQLEGLGVWHTDLQDLGDLANCPRLKGLTLVGAMDRTRLPTLARCTSLRELGLDLAPPLRDDELPLLHGLGQLKKLGITSDQVTEAGRAALRAALPHCQIKNEHW
jgi:hypothetical protein